MLLMPTCCVNQTVRSAFKGEKPPLACLVHQLTPLMTPKSNFYGIARIPLHAWSASTANAVALFDSTLLGRLLKTESSAASAMAARC